MKLSCRFDELQGLVLSASCHIETCGGKVLAAVALTSKLHSAKLLVTQDIPDEPRSKQEIALKVKGN